MRALVQRVKGASVAVEGQTVGQIDRGLLVFLGVRTDDTEAQAQFLADKCLNLRIFADEADKLNLSALDIGAELLIVSQFSLYGDCRRGRRPGFTDAARPDVSIPLYEKFLSLVKSSGLKTECGIFGADMQVSLLNDGPLTLMLEKEVN
jgi:D-tyrosyl-tRNA(Tyr) deacylase